MANLDVNSMLSPFTVGALAICFATIITLGSRLAKTPKELKVVPQTIPSPRETLIPYLTSAQIAALAYPPNLLPGARDVKTPYGTMKVYEWGPEDGMKVILIHGDTTPGPMLASIGKALASRGCRVMIYDLWGRGYSDTPLGVPHDTRLFVQQIFFAAASSSLPWIDPRSGGFSIVAFSLGGGIAMSFTAYFPRLVKSIILLAPGGLLRNLPEGYDNLAFRLAHFVPSSYLRRIVGDLLGVRLSAASLDYSNQSKVEGDYPLDASAIVQWQFDNHKGFVQSFISTIEHGPITNQHSDWRVVCNIIKGNISQVTSSNQSSKLFDSKILVIFGESDGVVIEKELSADLLDLIGNPRHLEIKVVPGGHGFPIPSSSNVVKHICRFWDLPDSPS